MGYALVDVEGANKITAGQRQRQVRQEVRRYGWPVRRSDRWAKEPEEEEDVQERSQPGLCEQQQQRVGLAEGRQGQESPGDVGGQALPGRRGQVPLVLRACGGLHTQGCRGSSTLAC